MRYYTYDSGDEGQRECARGERCKEATVITGPDGEKGRQAALGYQAFCRSDRLKVLAAVRSLPDRYVHLAAMLGEKAAGGEPKVSGTASPSVPVRTDVDALMVELLQTALAWWERVVAVARLSAMDGAVRDGYAVGRYCDTLAAHIDALIALPPEIMGRRVTPRKAAGLVAVGGVTGIIRPAAGYAEVYQERSGADAGLDFLTLEGRCRHLLGLTPRHEDLPVPCWACGEMTVRRWDGPAGLADEAECTSASCRETYTHERYQLLMAEVAEKQRARVAS